MYIVKGESHGAENESFLSPGPSSDKEMIKTILSEKESDAIVKDKLYRILYEASSADAVSMDTDLIAECVKTLDLIEGKAEELSEEKVQAMRLNIDRRYEDWRLSQRKIQCKNGLPKLRPALFSFSLRRPLSPVRLVTISSNLWFSGGKIPSIYLLKITQTSKTAMPILSKENL